MLKEISLGLFIALTIFAVIAGYDIFPLFIIAILGAALYFITQTKGIASLNNKGDNTPIPNISFDDIGGQAASIKELKEALDFIKDHEKVQKLGIRPLKGILFTGPPGTGKTLLAKGAAAYTDSIFIATSGSEFVEMYAGVGAQRVRKLFASARDRAKKQHKSTVVIFIDEVEILGATRGQNSSHMEYDQTLNELLVQLDGIKVDDSVRVLVVAATNRVDMLDPALLRPGRFDRQVRVELPDRQGRYEILNIHVQNKPLAKEVDLNIIAKETFGFSGAHLESLTNEAAILAMRDKSTKILFKHMQEAVDKVILGERLDRRPTKKELYRVAVHETGHALIAEMVQPGSVATLTVTPRGGALGYMRQHQEEDGYLYTKKHLDQQIAVILAGAVCEEIIIGSRSTGAANDFEKALQLAETIIKSGLSSLGIVDINELPKDKKLVEMQKILAQQEEMIAKKITNMKSIIEENVTLLLEKEKITGNELRAIIANRVA